MLKPYLAGLHQHRFTFDMLEKAHFLHPRTGDAWNELWDGLQGWECTGLHRSEVFLQFIMVHQLQVEVTLDGPFASLCNADMNGGCMEAQSPCSKFPWWVLTQPDDFRPQRLDNVASLFSIYNVLDLDSGCWEQAWQGTTDELTRIGLSMWNQWFTKVMDLTSIYMSYPWEIKSGHGKSPMNGGSDGKHLIDQWGRYLKPHYPWSTSLLEGFNIVHVGTWDSAWSIPRTWEVNHENHEIHSDETNGTSSMLFSINAWAYFHRRMMRIPRDFGGAGHIFRYFQWNPDDKPPRSW